jgi:hypothetical protein
MEEWVDGAFDRVQNLQRLVRVIKLLHHMASVDAVEGALAGSGHLRGESVTSYLFETASLIKLCTACGVAMAA